MGDARGMIARRSPLPQSVTRGWVYNEHWPKGTPLGSRYVSAFFYSVANGACWLLRASGTRSKFRTRAAVPVLVTCCGVIPRHRERPR